MIKGLIMSGFHCISFLGQLKVTVMSYQISGFHLRNDIMVLLSREDIFCSRENLSLQEEDLDVNRLDYYQVSRQVDSEWHRL